MNKQCSNLSNQCKIVRTKSRWRGATGANVGFKVNLDRSSWVLITVYLTLFICPLPQWWDSNM